MKLARLLLASVSVAALALASPSVASADASPASPTSPTAPASPAVFEAVPSALLSGLSNHAAAFEQMKMRGAFTMDGKVEEVDGDGKVSETKEMKLRVTPRPAQAPLTEVLRYVENGVDKTEEAREKAANRKPKKDKKEIRMPFLATEQARYVFAVVEHDRVHPERVKVSFVPKEPAEDAIKGSAWVDTTSSNVLSMGFSLSKNPTFVDHVDIQLTFGLQTTLGRAPSEITFDGRGGFLFVHKHYRGKATLSNARIAY